MWISLRRGRKPHILWVYCELPFGVAAADSAERFAKTLPLKDYPLKAIVVFCGLNRQVWSLSKRMMRTKSSKCSFVYAVEKVEKTKSRIFVCRIQDLDEEDEPRPSRALVSAMANPSHDMSIMMPRSGSNHQLSHPGSRRMTVDFGMHEMTTVSRRQSVVFTTNIRRQSINLVAQRKMLLE